VIVATDEIITSSSPDSKTSGLNARFTFVHPPYRPCFLPAHPLPELEAPSRRALLQMTLAARLGRHE